MKPWHFYILLGAIYLQASLSRNLRELVGVSAMMVGIATAIFEAVKG